MFSASASGALLRRPVVASVALILFAGTLYILAAVIAPSAASADPTTGSSCGQNSLDRTMGRGVRCINRINLKSRGGYLKSICITEDLSQRINDAYNPGECGSHGRGAEAIAQARFLNKHGGGQGELTGLSPNWQFEADIPNAVDYKRADILYYPVMDNALSMPIQVFEVKGNWAAGATKINNQVKAYVDGLNKTEHDLYGSEHAVARQLRVAIPARLC
jgi:hypothetical protein